MKTFAKLALITLLALNISTAEASDQQRQTNYQKLFNQLQAFKNDKEFHQYGFDECCKYSMWLKQVKAMKAASNAPISPTL
ncbi:hypothetical protein [Terasakiella sp. SH-1]|uniref:hypothetical protein n=1 Tax=Terasakiella sp. SH-1 TaxID=2560057 RepID=UPI001073CC47|nr:hypothetical protein [Terasakiella sp. SH-1]